MRGFCGRAEDLSHPSFIISIAMQRSRERIISTWARLGMPIPLPAFIQKWKENSSLITESSTDSMIRDHVVGSE